MWTHSLNESILIEKCWKHCGKKRNYSSWAISHFVAMFSKIRGARKPCGCLLRRGYHFDCNGSIHLIWTSPQLKTLSIQVIQLFPIYMYNKSAAVSLQLFNMADTLCLNRTFTQIRPRVNRYEDTKYFHYFVINKHNIKRKCVCFESIWNISQLEGIQF